MIHATAPNEDPSTLAPPRFGRVRGAVLVFAALVAATVGVLATAKAASMGSVALTQGMATTTMATSTVISVSLDTSEPGNGASGAYIAGDPIEVAVEFSPQVTVTGTPRIAINIGTATVYADYDANGFSASSTTLFFLHTVGASDSDADGISIGASALQLNGGSIQGSNGNPADLSLAGHAITDDGDYVVNGSGADVRAPTVTGYSYRTESSGNGASGVYIAGDVIRFTVHFSEGVTVTGTPRLALDIGGVTRYAPREYQVLDGKRQVFGYTVQSADDDPNGISVTSLELNGGTIKDSASNDANLSYSGFGGGNLADFVVDGDGADVRAPTVYTYTWSNVSSGSGASGAYIAGDVIRFNIVFSEEVIVTGAPRLALDIGGVTRYANRTGQIADGLEHIFRYTVQSTDDAPTGISITSLELNGGTIKDKATPTPNDATLGNSAFGSNIAHFVVDGDGADVRMPTVTSVWLDERRPGNGAGGAYIVGDVIEVHVSLSESVTVTGTPRIALNIGTATRYANWFSQQGSTQSFRYTVQTGDADADGISIGASAFQLNGGTIRDSSNNNADLSLTGYTIDNDGNFVVDSTGTDGRAPTVAWIYMDERSPGSGTDGAYIAGDEIRLSIYFSEVVTVTGTPRVALGIGNTTRYAERWSEGDGGRAQRFRYTVQSADEDADGISIGATALEFNGGTIKDSANNDAVLSLTGKTVTDNDDFVVDGDGADVRVPTVIGVHLDDRFPGSGTGGAYIAGDVIRIDVEFSEPVTVTGSPRFALDINGTSHYAERWSSWNNGQGQRFRYTVQSTDEDTTGVSIGASALELNGGTIKDAANNDANLSIPADLRVTNDLNFVVDGDGTDIRAPTVTDLTLVDHDDVLGNGVGGAYIAGDVIRVDLYFSEPVTVTGTPRIALTIGANTRYANWYYQERNTGSFRYTVQTGDADADGISIGATALELNGGTIKDRASNDADLSLTDLTVANHDDWVVNGGGTDVRAPTVNNIYLEENPPGSGAGGAYIAGDEIRISVFYSEAITVTGSPRIALNIGTTTRYAQLLHQWGEGHRFRYIVQSGDEDADGISFGASALQLNGGTIKDSANNDANLNLTGRTVTNDRDFIVDGDGADVRAPTVTSIYLQEGYPGNGMNGAYIAGDVIQVNLNFSEALAVTGSPRLALVIGANTRYAPYQFVTNNRLAFRYTVVAGDTDTDGISIGANALELNGGTIKDRAPTPNDADLSLTGHTVDNDGDFTVNGGGSDIRAPTVTGVNLADPRGGSGNGGVYIEGDEIRVEMEFSEPVTFTGTPRVALTIGTGTGYAEPSSSWDGGRGQVFRYTVQSGDEDSNGISIGASALELNGGTIKDRAPTPNNADLSLSGLAITDNDDFVVDGDAADIPPRVTRLGLVNDFSFVKGSGADGAYIAGDVLRVDLRFSEPVTITGSPQVGFTIGSNTRYASLHSQYDGRRGHDFRYTVQSSDADADGISIGPSALRLNGGTIKDSADNDANLSLSGLDFSNDDDFVVDGDGADVRVPTVTEVNLNAFVPGNGAAGAYIAGDAIRIDIWFSEAVTVTGTPRIALGIGTATRYAEKYAQGFDGRLQRFRYEVQASDADADGVSIGAAALQLNGGTIKDGANNNADLDLTGHTATNDSDFVVNGGGSDVRAPTVLEVNMADPRRGRGTGGTYIAGDVIGVELYFSEPVTVTGTPRIALTIGTATRYADRWSQRDSGQGQRFRYTVQPGDADSDGISIGATALELNGGMIKDSATPTPNDANLSLTGNTVTNDDDFVVDGNGADIPPTVTGVWLDDGFTGNGTGGAYIAGDVIRIDVEFSEPVTVTGSPRIALTIGTGSNSTRYAERWSQWNGGQGQRFRYTVQSSDADPDGISIGAAALELNGGTIKDSADNDANLSLTGHTVTNDDDFVVDGDGADVRVPKVTSLTLVNQFDGLEGNGADGAYIEDDRIRVDLFFSEPVTVTGTPRIALKIGDNTRYAERTGQGVGGRAQIFIYRIQFTDEDTDGISIEADALQLNGGTIKDGGDNAANRSLAGHTVTNDGDFVVDGDGDDDRAPTVDTRVWLNGTLGGKGMGGVYIAGDVIEAAVRFSEAVIVTGTPQLALSMGAGTGQADWDRAHTNPRWQFFRYTVQSADEDTDGISIGASALTLNGGMIRDGSANDANLDLTGNTVTDDDRFVVDGDGGDAAPTVTGVHLDDRFPGSGTGGAYIAGDVIRIDVEFSEPVTVTGTPRIALTIGTGPNSTRYAERWSQWNGGQGQRFRYTVQSTDEDLDGVSIGATALQLNGGAIKDTATPTPNDADLSLTGHTVTDDDDFVVDGDGADVRAPTVTELNLNEDFVGRGSGGAYIAGDEIRLDVWFSEAVTFTGSPRIALTIGAATRYAEKYAQGFDGRLQRFRYTVQATDADANGISIGDSALERNGGTIRDGSNNNADLSLTGHTVTDNDEFVVDGDGNDVRAPTVTSIWLNTSLAGNDTNGAYIAGDVIQVNLFFSEALAVTGSPLAVTGSPRLALTIGTGPNSTRYAPYQFVTNNRLAFRYTVVAGDTDTDGISIGANALELNGGTIKDRAPTPNNADLSLTGHTVDNNSDFKVNGGGSDVRAPTVTGVNLADPRGGSGAGGVYIEGDEIQVEMEFSEPVTFTGTPRVALTIGTGTGYAEPSFSWDGNRGQVFRYTIQSGDEDADGISIGATALELNGATIKDSATPTPNDADLSLTGLTITDNGDFVVDGDGADTRPATVTSIYLQQGLPGNGAGGAYIAGDVIQVNLNFSEALAVTGSPRLALVIGANTRYAPYQFVTNNRLAFRYTVVADDMDNDGISIGADAVDLDGATIRDAAGKNADLDLTGHTVTDNGDFVVDGDGADTRDPTVTSFYLDDRFPGSGDDGSYIAGDLIRVDVEFSESVTVTRSPRLALTIGAHTRHAERWSEWDDGRGQRFRYLVRSADLDTDGISIGADAFNLNGGTIQDAAGRNANLSLVAVDNDGDFVVRGRGRDTTAPAPGGMWFNHVPDAGDTYLRGSVISVVVRYPEAITVTGDPRLRLTIGSTGRYARRIASKDFPSLLLFNYEVTADDADADGISIAANALELPGGARIRDRHGNDVRRSLGDHAITNDGAHRVDGSRADTTGPTVTGAGITRPADGTDTHKGGQEIGVWVSFSEPVTITGNSAAGAGADDRRELARRRLPILVAEPAAISTSTTRCRRATWMRAASPSPPTPCRRAGRR